MRPALASRRAGGRDGPRRRSGQSVPHHRAAGRRCPRAGRGDRRARSRSIATASRSGSPSGAARTAASNRTTGEMSPLPSSSSSTRTGSSSGASAPGCSSSRTGSTSIATATSGSPTARTTRRRRRPGPRQRRRARGPPPGATKGHQVFKFSPDGKLLLTLGTPGGAADPGYFFQPNDVVTAPERRHLRRGGARRRERAHPEILEGRQADQGDRQEGHRPRRVRPAARARVRFEGPAVRRRPQQQPHPDPRPGREVPRGVDAVQPPERDLHRQERHHLRRGLGVGLGRERTEPDGKARHPDRQHQGRQVTAFIPDPIEKATNTSAAEGVAVDPRGTSTAPKSGRRR